MNHIKQVVMLHYTIPPVVGGVEFMIEPLSELFVKNGWHVSLITGMGNINKPNIKTTLIPELFPGNPTIARIQENLKIGSYPENYEIEVTKFEKKLMTQIGNIKNIIIHNIMTMSFNLVATHALYNYIENNPDKNFYVWIHDMAWLMDDYQKHLFENKPWSLLKTANLNVQYITISRFRKRQVETLFKINSNKIKIVPNGIEINDFLQLKEPTRRLLSKIPIQNFINMILVPARILPRKNLLRTLDILNELIKIDPTITAVFPGHPDQSNSLSMEYYEIIKNHIKKLGISKNNLVFFSDDVADLQLTDKENREIVHDSYNLCRGVMLLSSDEGFGIPLLEAGIAQKPLILSDIEVFHEIAGKNAIFISEVEPVSVAAKDIYNKIFKFSSSTSAMFENVIKNYSWDAIWKNFLSKIFD